MEAAPAALEYGCSSSSGSLHTATRIVWLAELKVPCLTQQSKVDLQELGNPSGSRCLDFYTSSGRVESFHEFDIWIDIHSETAISLAVWFPFTVQLMGTTARRV